MCRERERKGEREERDTMISSGSAGHGFYIVFQRQSLVQI